MSIPGCSVHAWIAHTLRGLSDFMISFPGFASNHCCAVAIFPKCSPNPVFIFHGLGGTVRLSKFWGTHGHDTVRRQTVKGYGHDTVGRQTVGDPRTRHRWATNRGGGAVLALKFKINNNLNRDAQDFKSKSSTFWVSNPKTKLKKVSNFKQSFDLSRKSKNWKKKVVKSSTFLLKF